MLRLALRTPLLRQVILLLHRQYHRLLHRMMAYLLCLLIPILFEELCGRCLRVPTTSPVINFLRRHEGVARMAKRFAVLRVRKFLEKLAQP